MVSKSFFFCADADEVLLCSGVKEASSPEDEELGNI